MATIVRANYDDLARIAGVFEREADRMRQSLQGIQRTVEVLQNGDWIGQGATTFYQEMNSEVLPAMKRLESALEAAGRTTREISRVMRASEEEVARLFSVVGGLAAAGLGAGMTGAVAGAVAEAIQAAAGALAGAAQAVAEAAAAAQAAATARFLSGLDPKVAEIAQQSPTLGGMLVQLERDGWTITTRDGGGSETDRQNTTLVIDTSGAPEVQVGRLAHEGAHALYGTPPFHRPTDDMTREQFIQVNLREQMLNEANSQFHEALVRDEVLGNGGPDTGVSGNFSADYQRIYNEYREGDITREQAVGQMADIFPDETTGTTGQTYRDYYTPTFADWWDEHIAPARRGAQ